MGYKDQVKGSLDTSPGFMIRADGMPHRTTTPDWEKETRVRVFPTPLDDGGWGELRATADDHDFGPAVWSEPVARCLGVNEAFTYITRIPGKTGDPTNLFVRAIISIIDEKPRDVPEAWLEWVKRGKNKPPKIDKVKSAIFFQGMLVMSQGKLLVNAMKQPAPQYPILFMGSVSLQMSFEAMANARALVPGTEPPQPAYNGPLPGSIPGQDEASRRQRDAIYAQMFEIGDWCSLDGGNILSFAKAPASGQFERPHYGIQIAESLPLRSIEQQVRDCWRPWDKLLRYHTAEEQVHYLCRAFPAEAVDYAFSTTEYRDMIPQNVKGAWQRYRAAQQAWTPGMSGTGAPAPAPAVAPAAAPAAQVAPAVAPAAPAAPVAPVAPAAVVPPAVAPATMPVTGAPAPLPPAAPAAVAPAAPAAPVAPAPAATGAPMPAGAPGAPVQPAAVAGYDLSGAPVAPAGATPPIMESGAFGATPPEFANPGAPAGAVPQTPAQPSQGTPPQAVAGGAVDGGALSAALNDLKGSRKDAAEGNLGPQ